LPDVSIVQTTDFADGHDVAEFRWLDWPPVGSVFGEGQVGPGVVVIDEVVRQDVAQMALAQDENVVKTLTADRADKAFRERILPRAVRRREDLLDRHALHALPKWLTVDLVTITQKIDGRRVVRESIHDLLSSPGGAGVLGYVEVGDTPAVVIQHD
jgi:hypothetical protein